MPGEALDAILELTPGRKMRGTIAGESTDKQKAQSSAAVIEISMFRFGNAKSLAKAKSNRDRDKLDEAKRDQKDVEEEEDRKIREARERAAPRSGNIEQDYRFQVTKQLEKSTPHLMQAFFSNSYKPKRQESNSFKEAKITVRKVTSTGPKEFLSLTFRGVYIVGYELQTMGKEPPEETVEFCFKTCEMKYTQQESSGEMGQSSVMGWNFVDQKEMSAS